MTFKNVLKALFAGMLVGLTGIEFIFVKQFDFSLNQFTAAFIFPFGNTLILVLSLLLFNGQVARLINKDDLIKPLHLLVMLLINILGVIFVGLLFSILKNKNIEIIDRMVLVADNKFPDYSIKYHFNLFLKAMFCGMFIYIGGFFFRYFKKPFLKVIGIWLPVFIYVYSGFNNGITDVYYLIASNRFSFVSIIFILTAILGNASGALLLQIIRNISIKKYKQLNE